MTVEKAWIEHDFASGQMAWGTAGERNGLLNHKMRALFSLLLDVICPDCCLAKRTRWLFRTGWQESREANSAERCCSDIVPSFKQQSNSTGPACYLRGWGKIASIACPTGQDGKRATEAPDMKQKFSWTFDNPWRSNCSIILVWSFWMFLEFLINVCKIHSQRVWARALSVCPACQARMLRD